jgi:hypothetical protein
VISSSYGGEYEDESSGRLHRVVSYKYTGVSEALTASITVLMMEVVSTSETLVYYDTTQHNIPEGHSNSNLLKLLSLTADAIMQRPHICLIILNRSSPE